MPVTMVLSPGSGCMEWQLGCGVGGLIVCSYVFAILHRRRLHHRRCLEFNERTKKKKKKKKIGELDSYLEGFGP
jgi:hypothetical protein